MGVIDQHFGPHKPQDDVAGWTTSGAQEEGVSFPFHAARHMVAVYRTPVLYPTKGSRFGLAVRC